MWMENNITEADLAEVQNCVKQLANICTEIVEKITQKSEKISTYSDLMDFCIELYDWERNLQEAFVCAIVMNGAITCKAKELTIVSDRKEE